MFTMSRIIVCKLFAMLILSLGSYLVGILPVLFRLNRDSASSFLLSLLLCFGGGVLLSTSFLHILPESRTLLPDWADFIFCGGFFLLYFIDELVRLITTAGVPEDEHLISHDATRETYVCPTHPNNEIEQSERVETKSRFGIFLAISVHSVIEGSAIGVQTAFEKVLLLLSAVSSHKLVVAFCLGIELSSDGRTFASLNRAMLLFSIGSTVGIISGMFVETESSVIVPFLQALAAGSLLYVAVSEVLPRERSRFKTNNTFKAVGLFQFIALVSGFVLIRVLDHVL